MSSGRGEGLYVRGRQVAYPPQGAMNKPEHFEIVEDYAAFRPSGQVSLEEGVQLITSALVYAREQQIKKLLVVTTSLTGFKPPSLLDRYHYIREWVSAAQGHVCVAIVVKPDLIDPDKIGMLVAKSAGLQADVFASEGEARAWLKSVKWVSQEERIKLRSRVTSPTP